MVNSFRSLDFSEMFAPGTERVLITLTYPGNWRSVVPDGKVAAGHLDELFRRFTRAFGHEPRALWSREFMKSGAPHFHLILQVPDGPVGKHHREAYEARLAEWREGRRASKPRLSKPALEGLTFEQWLRKTWPEIVSHQDAAERAKHEEHGVYIKAWTSDGPEHAIAYFADKRGGSKGYQTKVPEMWLESGQVGRHWGRRGLKPAVSIVQIPKDVLIAISRILRRMKRNIFVWNEEAQTRECRPALKRDRRPRGPILGYEVDEHGILRPQQRPRWTTVRRRFISHTGAGTIYPEDGPTFARILYSYLTASTLSGETPVDSLPVGMRGPISDRVARRVNARQREAGFALAR